MPYETIALDGCRPTPLAGYLKALGIMRLIAEQADPTVSCYWKNDVFHLRSRLDRAALRQFFLEICNPTPIIAPWNGGSGFYPNDAKDGIAPLAKSSARRFASYRTAIGLGERLLAEHGLTERPTDATKTRLIAAIRAEAEEKVVEWLDAAVALTSSKLAFPPLLGTGGNDGRLDFTNNFMQRLVELIDPESGAPTARSSWLLDNALFAEPVFGLAGVAIGQFAPGSAGGPNASTGYEAPSRVNGWDFVLAVEGTVTFAGGVSRRFEGTEGSALSYPFTVRAAAAGFGTASLEEQRESRGEIWAPLWERPSSLAEIRVLFREGRISLGSRPARDGLDAARAVAGLGADRRIAAFERYGLVKRQGLAYLATPLGRRAVRLSPVGDLVADLDRGRWLEILRRDAAAPEAPERLRQAVRDIEEAVFELTGSPEHPSRVQALLAAIGKAARVLANSPKLQDRLRPPPRLGSDWIRHADDESPEFRIAVALASLRAAAAVASELDQEALPDGASEQRRRWILPMRAHLAPLDRQSGTRWDPVEGDALAVWGNGGIVANLCAVAQRRLLEHSRLGLRDKPFSAVGGVGSGDIAHFLYGSTATLERIAVLLEGLVWVEPGALKSGSPGLLPLAYAALKPLFTPDSVLTNPVVGRPKEFSLPIPPALPGLLSANRLPEAVQLGMERARSSGLPVPFIEARPQFVDGRRLLAMLIIPVHTGVVRDCLTQAYLPLEEPTDAA